MVFGGDQLVGRAVVSVCVPGIVGVGAVFGQDALLHQIRPGGWLVDADGAERGHGDTRLAIWATPGPGAGAGWFVAGAWWW